MPRMCTHPECRTAEKAMLQEQRATLPEVAAVSSREVVCRQVSAPPTEPPPALELEPASHLVGGLGGVDAAFAAQHACDVYLVQPAEELSKLQTFLASAKAELERRRDELQAYFVDQVASLQQYVDLLAAREIELAHSEALIAKRQAEVTQREAEATALHDTAREKLTAAAALAETPAPETPASETPA